MRIFQQLFNRLWSARADARLLRAVYDMCEIVFALARLRENQMKHPALPGIAEGWRHGPDDAMLVALFILFRVHRRSRHPDTRVYVSESIDRLRRAGHIPEFRITNRNQGQDIRRIERAIFLSSIELGLRGVNIWLAIESMPGISRRFARLIVNATLNDGMLNELDELADDLRRPLASQGFSIRGRVGLLRMGGPGTDTTVPADDPRMPSPDPYVDVSRDGLIEAWPDDANQPVTGFNGRWERLEFLPQTPTPWLRLLGNHLRQCVLSWGEIISRKTTYEVRIRARRRRDPPIDDLLQDFLQHIKLPEDRPLTHVLHLQYDNRPPRSVGVLPEGNYVSISRECHTPEGSSLTTRPDLHPIDSTNQGTEQISQAIHGTGEDEIQSSPPTIGGEIDQGPSTYRTSRPVQGHSEMSREDLEESVFAQISSILDEIVFSFSPWLQNIPPHYRNIVDNLKAEKKAEKAEEDSGTSIRCNQIWDCIKRLFGKATVPLQKGHETPIDGAADFASVQVEQNSEDYYSYRPWTALVALIHPEKPVMLDDVLVFSETKVAHTVGELDTGGLIYTLPSHRTCEKHANIENRMRKLRATSDGASRRLPEFVRIVSVLYLVGTLSFAVYVAVENVANRDNWFTRASDCLSVVTISWVSLFGLVKIFVDDPEFLRNLLFGRRVFRTAEAVYGYLGDEVDVKTVLACAEDILPWVDSKDMVFARAELRGKIELRGGLTAEQLHRAGWVFGRNFAYDIFNRRSCKTKLKNGFLHVDKSQTYGLPPCEDIILHHVENTAIMGG